MRKEGIDRDAKNNEGRKVIFFSHNP